MSRFSPHNIYPPFYRSSTSGDTAPTLEAAARERLVASVAGLTEVYLAVTGSRAVMPFAIVSPLRFSLPTITNTSAYYEITPLQVTVFSESDTDAVSLGRSCIRAFNAAPKLQFADGYHMAGWPAGVRQWPASGVGPGGKLAFRFEFDWIFMVGRDLA